MPAGATTYSARAPPAISPITSSPIANTVTSEPIAATVPAMSIPRVAMRGRRRPDTGRMSSGTPRITLTSPELMEVARTLRSTSAGPGTGTATRSMRTASGPP